MIAKSFNDLFGKECPYNTSLIYTAKFSDYNANVRFNGKQLDVRLSKKWKTHSEDLQIGIIQHLLAKLFKIKNKTWQMEVYEKFMKKIGDNTIINNVDPTLKEYFDIINNKYFAGMLDMTNLRWGTESYTILGRYEYGSNTITMSTVLKERPDLLAYVLYHEMLHKKHKFEHQGSRAIHHSKKFREEEKKFELANAEEELNKFLRNKKRKFRFF